MISHPPLIFCFAADLGENRPNQKDNLEFNRDHSEIRMHDGKPIFPNPSILNDFPIQNGQTSIGIDRSWHCGYFGLYVCLRKSIFRIKTCWNVGFLDFSMIVL